LLSWDLKSTPSLFSFSIAIAFNFSSINFLSASSFFLLFSSAISTDVLMCLIIFPLLYSTSCRGMSSSEKIAVSLRDCRSLASGSYSHLTITLLLASTTYQLASLMLSARSAIAKTSIMTLMAPSLI